MLRETRTRKTPEQTPARTYMKVNWADKKWTNGNSKEAGQGGIIIASPFSAWLLLVQLSFWKKARLSSHALCRGEAKTRGEILVAKQPFVQNDVQDMPPACGTLDDIPSLILPTFPIPYNSKQRDQQNKQHLSAITELLPSLIHAWTWNKPKAHEAGFQLPNNAKYKFALDPRGIIKVRLGLFPTGSGPL